MKLSRGANWSQFILSCGHEMYWMGALNLAAVARTTHNVENWTRLSNLKVSSAAAALAQLINCTIKRLWGMHQTWEGRGTVSVRRGLNVMETDLTGSDYCSSCTSLTPRQRCISEWEVQWVRLTRHNDFFSLEEKTNSFERLEKSILMWIMSRIKDNRSKQASYIFLGGFLSFNQRDQHQLLQL